MSKVKITYAQRRCLRVMEVPDAIPGTRCWYNAYDLRESRCTLDALVSKGFIERRNERGAIFSPRTSVFFRRKDLADAV
jgi:hypothetical protein